MADNPQNAGRERPLSPHLTIWRWQVTMLSSITHRATGIALSVGALVLAWWLVAISNGPEGYDGFMRYAASPIGIIVMFGFTWSLFHHLMGGLRHFVWEAGHGMEHPQREYLAQATLAGGLVLTILVWIVAYMVR